MSDDNSKIKHSRRRQLDMTAAHRQSDILRSHGVRVDTEHRYVKRHAMDCGNPNCYLCASPRKTIKEKTIQEKSFEQKKLHDEA